MRTCIPTIYRTGYALITVIAVAAFAGVAQGQIASSLINEGDLIDSNAFPGVVVTGTDNVAVNSIGGWSTNIGGTGGIDFIYGSVDGVSAPGVLRVEATIDGITQNSFESRFGMSDTGSVCYSASISSPHGGTDSVYVDSVGIAIDGIEITTGPLAGLFWSFGSAPQMSANGIAYFSGGTAITSTGATTARGIWAGGSETPLLYTGDEILGLPAPIDAGNSIDFSYKFSRFGTQYLLDVFVETTDTPVPTTQDACMVKSGEGLFLDGQLVQEGFPVPPAIGGIGGENWSSTSFDFKGISDMGEYLFTGDTSGDTSMDEIMVLNGMIHLREGDVLGAHTLSGSIEAADMNNNGDWALVWQTAGGTSLIYNDQVVLIVGDLVDFNGDGVIDAGDNGATVADFEVFTNAMVVGDRDPSGNVSVYLPLDVDVDGVGPNTTLAEGIYKITFTEPAGPAGDLQLAVTDSPDPQTMVPGDITYTVKVRNNSGASIDNVVATSNLAPGLVFNAGASDPIAIHAAGVVTANIGTMAAFSTTTYKFVATAPVAGMYTTNTSVAGDTADTVPGNNDAVNVTEVGKSTDLIVTITDNPDPVVTAGGTIEYTVDVFNDGPSNATGVALTMNLDPTTVFNAGLSDPDVAHAAGVVTANIGALGVDVGTNFLVVVNVTSQGLLTADATVTGNESDPIPENNTFIETTLFQLTTDLSITISDDPDPVLPAGGPVTLTVTVANAGPTDASEVMAEVTLDNTVTFVSADPPGVHDGSPTGGVVSFNIGNLAVGSNGVFNIVANTSDPARVVTLGSVDGSDNETDPDLGNNQTLINTLVLDDARGLSKVVFSNFAASPTSDVPDLPGVKFDAAHVDAPFRSPNGKLWIISADTDAATTQDEVIIVGSHCSASTIIQEGVTMLDMGDFVGFIDSGLSINDAGQFAFATNTDAATSADEVIVRWDGSQTFVIAREGNISPITGGNYGFSLAAPNIVNDNTVWFDADTTLATSMDRFLLSKNGVIIVAQEGVTIPTGQKGGAMDPWQTFSTGSLFVDETGDNYIVVGDTSGDTASDGMAVVNGAVVAQEGSVIAGSGFASPAIVNTSTEPRMMGNGDWTLRGSNSDSDDWALHSGVVVGKTGDPIHAGAIEQYDDASFSVGFFLAAANNAGDYILGSVTNAGEVFSDAVLTVNGQALVGREHDPIDLDGNNLVDDGIRIRTFGNDDLILTEDLQAYYTATVRDFNDDGSNTEIGDVFGRFNLCGVATHCGDLDNDKDVDADDFDIFVLAFGKSTCDPEYHICADFDEDGIVTQVDYQNWLLCYRGFVGNPLASVPTTAMGDFDRDGDVDLYDYSQFQACSGESSVPCRARFDFDEDAVVTPADAPGFVELLTGP